MLGANFTMLTALMPTFDAAFAMEPKNQKMYTLKGG
jgi:hypothetical protein